MAADTSANLVATAERLFAERGVDAVSLREIAREAGARNVMAVQYHFTDRAGVLAAIADKHLPVVDARRDALLDGIESEARPSMRAMASALVRPLAVKLGDPDGGSAFLRIHADLLNRPVPSFDLTGRSGSLQRWRALLEPMLDPVAVTLHPRFGALVYAAVELGRRAATAPHADDRLFISHLVDTVAAMLAAPLSDESRSLAKERQARRHVHLPVR
ncbi:helix-turn-helix domain-containing protein [Mycolicibacterium aichiense]|uniref:Transcriptional regulator, TetR family protein n=1 Tax=Mycolicibacterium aichiense TaxID=1799 RepID=A0AAD1HTK2_9MYCO|nr:helix-turn-helix domain-containing protein [Mycolicibacterium aichiense]MCV7016857.1 helix-turn-helix transcriptional regulator [Mycolicibacterium aichiense]BBX10721.1 putative transcriptional regulator, TetR family protein [Mycolicibacterium aichiense]STZ25622.1 TetR family transcriptional regulator [Mycolicibacterium aichiense]